MKMSIGHSSTKTGEYTSPLGKTQPAKPFTGPVVLGETDSDEKAADADAHHREQPPYEPTHTGWDAYDCV